MIELNGVYKHINNANIHSRTSLTIDCSGLYVLRDRNACASGAARAGYVSAAEALLRIMSGISRTDGGTVVVDDMPVYNNVSAMERIFYVPDEIYFPFGSSLEKLASYYRRYYVNLSVEQLRILGRECGIDTDIKLRKLSSDRKYLAALLLGISAHTEYLLCGFSLSFMKDDDKRTAIKLLRETSKERAVVIAMVAEDSLMEELSEVATVYDIE